MVRAMELKMKGYFNIFEIDRLEWFCNLYIEFLCDR